MQSFNYGTVFYVGDQGVLIFDTLEGVYDNIAAAVASVTDKPITAAIYPHYHADHIGDIDKYVAAADQAGQSLRIFGSEKTPPVDGAEQQLVPAITDVVDGRTAASSSRTCTVELHGFEWAAHTDDHAAWLLLEDRIIHSSDLINPDQPPFWKFAGNERFHWHEHNLRQVYDLDWDHLSGSHGNLGTREDIDFEFAFLADMKAAVGEAIGAHPFTDFVDPSARAHTGSWPTGLRHIARDVDRCAAPEVRPALRVRGRHHPQRRDGGLGALRVPVTMTTAPAGRREVTAAVVREAGSFDLGDRAHGASARRTRSWSASSPPGSATPTSSSGTRCTRCRCRSCSATRAPASSRPWAAASPRSRPATTSR